MNVKSSSKIFIICILLSTIFTGCSLEDATMTNGNNPLPSTNKYENHLSISVGYWNIENLSNTGNNDEFMNYIENLFNITIQPVSVTWSNYKENYQILNATNSLPDVFATLTLSSSDNNDSAFLTDLIKNGSIKALPENLSSYPNMEALMDSVPYTRYSDGQFYAIPRTSFTDPILGATDAVMLVRRDWMDHLGISNPNSFEEFLAMTTAFTKNDPDGNGIDDTVGYNVNKISALGKWVMLGIAPECNVYSWIQLGDRYVPSWSTNEFNDVIVAYRKLYQSGSLDPNFLSKNPSSVIEDFARDRLGTLEYKVSPSTLLEIKTIWDVYNTKPFEECVDFLPIFPAPDGIQYSNSSSTFWSESLISSNVSDEKMERIIALFDFLLSKEGMELCQYGIPEVDYTYTEQNYELLIVLNGKSLKSTLMEKYPSFYLFSSLATWGGSWSDYEDNAINSIKYSSSCVNLARNTLLWYSENTLQVQRPYEFLMYPKEPTELFSTQQAFNAFINCIIGNKDPVQMWQAYLDNLYEQGFDEYIDSQNNNYNNAK